VGTIILEKYRGDGWSRVKLARPLGQWREKCRGERMASSRGGGRRIRGIGGRRTSGKTKNLGTEGRALAKKR